jgi:hypothetical protein
MSTNSIITAPPGSRRSALWRNLKAIEIVWYREILRYVRDWVRFIFFYLILLHEKRDERSFIPLIPRHDPGSEPLVLTHGRCRRRSDFLGPG